MTHFEIVEELARNRTVEEIVDNISKKTFPYTDELALNYFIVRMVRNNLFSRNSPYYQTYIRWDERKSELTDNIKDTITE